MRSDMLYICLCLIDYYTQKCIAVQLLQSWNMNTFAKSLVTNGYGLVQIHFSFVPVWSNSFLPNVMIRPTGLHKNLIQFRRDQFSVLPSTADGGIAKSKCSDRAENETLLNVNGGDGCYYTEWLAIPALRWTLNLKANSKSELGISQSPIRPFCARCLSIWSSCSPSDSARPRQIRTSSKRY